MKRTIIGIKKKFRNYILLTDLFILLLIISLFLIIIKKNNSSDNYVFKSITYNIENKKLKNISEKKILKEGNKLYYYIDDKKTLNNDIIIINNKPYKNSLSGIVTNENSCTNMSCTNSSSEGIYHELSKYLILINKNNKVSEDFKPSQTSKINSDTLLEKEAASQYEKMVKSFVKNTKRKKFQVVSGYRSYKEQKQTKKHWIEVYGKEANNVSADKGTSEHQSGLAIDILENRNTKLSTNFEKTEEYKWLTSNAYKFGYILRYPKSKKSITKYDFEPWHYRYVGIQASYEIHNQNNNMTLEEYYEYKNYFKH